MDVYCKRCGEPWDLYGVQHTDFDAGERRRFWDGQGCPSCYGKSPESQEKGCCLLDGEYDCPDGNPDACDCGCHRLRRRLKARPFRAMVMESLHEVLGDDLDGLAAELEDAEYSMGAEFWN